MLKFVEKEKVTVDRIPTLDEEKVKDIIIHLLQGQHRVLEWEMVNERYERKVVVTAALGEEGKPRKYTLTIEEHR